MNAQCSAKSKQTGQRCKLPPVPGRNVCRFHGGKTLTGVASPNLKHGRYSKWLPSHLTERYEQSIDDPELLNMRHDISLLDARLSDLLGRVDKMEARKLWEEVRTAHDQMKAAILNENYGALMVELEKLDRSVGIGLADYDAWNEIEKLIDQRRKLVESEQKRLVAMQQMITSEQAMTFVMSVLSLVKENVTDKKALNAIQMGVSLFLNKSEVA